MKTDIRAASAPPADAYDMTRENEAFCRKLSLRMSQIGCQKATARQQLRGLASGAAIALVDANSLVSRAIALLSRETTATFNVLTAGKSPSDGLNDYLQFVLSPSALMADPLQPLSLAAALEQSSLDERISPELVAAGLEFLVILRRHLILAGHGASRPKLLSKWLLDRIGATVAMASRHWGRRVARAFRLVTPLPAARVERARPHSQVHWQNAAESASMALGFCRPLAPGLTSAPTERLRPSNFSKTITGG